MSYTDAEFEGTIEDNYNYLINKKPHWKNFFNKLRKTIHNKKIHKC
jgi:hypothetical protein